MTKIEELFYKIDSKTEEIKKENDFSYLTALASYLRLEDDAEYFDLIDNYTKEDIMKVYQFLLLKAIKELGDVNYGLTPEIIAIYIASIAQEIFKDEKISVLDMASGSGNLIFALMDKLKEGASYTSVEVDSDYALLQQDIFNLLEKEVEIIRQDTLKPINVSPRDLVVSDVPVGYYIDDDNALNYKLCSSEGHSLNTFLFLEQAKNYLDDKRGVAVLVMPKEFMNLDEKIKKYIEEDININAFIMLPEEMFKKKEQEKIIVIASKKTNEILPKQVFLGQITSFQSKSAYTNFINNLNAWLNAK